MAQTRRTDASIDALLADNDPGKAIDAEDLRDAIESGRVHRQSGPPDGNDDSVGTGGTIFDVGHFILDESTAFLYVCRDATATSAAWECLNCSGVGAKNRYVGTVLRDATLTADGSLDLGGLALGGYDRVELVGRVRADNVADLLGVFLRFNADSGANYNSAGGTIESDGTLLDAGSDGLATNEGYVAGVISDGHSAADAYSSLSLVIEDPGGADHKSWRSHFSADDPDSLLTAQAGVAGGRWAGTSAIDEITFHTGAGAAVDFKAGSRLQLVGYREEPVGNNLAIEVVRSIEVRNSADQNVADTGTADIEFDTVIHNDGGFTLDTNEVVVSTAGRYRVWAFGIIATGSGDGDADDFCQMAVQPRSALDTNIAGSGYTQRFRGQESGFQTASISGFFDLEAGQRVAVQWSNNLGATRAIQGTGNLKARLVVEKVIPSVDATKFIDPTFVVVIGDAGTTSITASSYQVAPIDTVQQGDASMADLPNNRVVIPRDGVYRIRGRAGFQDDANLVDAFLAGALRINPTGAATGGNLVARDFRYAHYVSGGSLPRWTVNPEYTAFFSKDDEVELNVYQEADQVGNRGAVNLDDADTRIEVVELQAPAARVGMLGDTLILTSDQSTTDATAHTVDWDAYLQNDLGGVDLSGDPDRWVCPQAGWYGISFFALFAGNNTGRRLLWIYKNGTSEIWFTTENDANAATSNGDYLTTGGDMYLEEGDTLDFVTYQSSGGNLNIKGDSGTPSQTVASIVSLSSIFGQYPEASDAEIEAGTSDQSRIITPAQLKLSVITHGRERLEAAKTFYVDADSGSDTTGDGESSTPWESVQYAIDELWKKWDFNRQAVTLQLNDATADYAKFIVTGSPVGSSTINIQGESESGVTVGVGLSEQGILAFEGAFVILGNMTLEVQGNGAVGLFAASNSTLNINNNITFTEDGTPRANTNFMLGDRGGTFRFIGVSNTLTVDTVDPDTLAWMRWWSRLIFDSAWTIAHANTVAYGFAAYYAQHHSTITYNVAPTITGTNTGKRWDIQRMSQLIYGATANVPGSTAGSTATGGRADAS